MDCPVCGRSNPPESFVCECGWDLNAQHVQKPFGEINLAWRQMLAAYWSIAWPSTIALPVILDLFPIPQGNVAGSAPDFLVFLLWQLLFFGGQALLIPRLTRKNYSTWNLSVLRESSERSRHLSLTESGRIAVWVIAPQLAWLVLWAFVNRQLPSAAMRFSTLLSALMFLVIGPYSVGLALRLKHRGFRLVAHGYRVGTLR